MRRELTARHLEITPALSRLVDRKLARLERLLNRSALSAHVVLAREKHRLITELTVHARGEKFVHAAEEATTWELSIRRAVEKAVQQGSQIKGKWEARTRRAAVGERARGASTRSSRAKRRTER